MYKVTAYFRSHRVTKLFLDLYEAIDFKDTADAHYPIKVTFEEGKNPVRGFIVSGWYNVMDHRYNPLKNIPDLNTRHMVMQVLAWMWCIVFSFYVGSFFIMGVSMVAHALILAAIVLTVATFETAKRKPTVFSLRTDGYHSVSRNRSYVIYHNERGHPIKIYMDANDPGGEHE